MVLEQKNVLVTGLGISGVAACEQLRRSGARVWAIDGADTPRLREQAAHLAALGVETLLGTEAIPPVEFDLVVTSPGVPPTSPAMREVARRKWPLIGELELGCRLCRCLSIAITGTNGKTTTTELVERLLTQNQIKTVAAGNIGHPVCSVVEQSAKLDYLTLEVSSFQLETIETFRPMIAVVMNLTPDHFDRYPGMPDYIRAKARMFENQQPFDWAIIQSEALAQLRALDVRIPSKIVTFSATDDRADIVFDRGLLISRLPEWPGPLLDMADTRLRGPHNAENLMAALAVGRILRIPFEGMAAALKSYTPAPHRCELVAEIGGVKYVNDSKATNVDAVQKALLSIPSAPGGAANTWLIAGGKDKGFDFHDLGPILARRVKGGFLIGETRERLRAAWSLFTPCTPVDSLLEAVERAAAQAVAGDTVLLSPACSSFDQFRNYQHRGEVFREAVLSLAKRSGSAGAGSEQ